MAPKGPTQRSYRHCDALLTSQQLRFELIMSLESAHDVNQCLLVLRNGERGQSDDSPRVTVNAHRPIK